MKEKENEKNRNRKPLYEKYIYLNVFWKITDRPTGQINFIFDDKENRHEKSIWEIHVHSLGL